VSVYGTGNRGNALEFSWRMVQTIQFSTRPPCRLAARALSIARCSLHTRLQRIIHSRCRNIKPASSIAYALRPRLRSRLTLGGRTFPRKPWVYGGRGFHPSYRYSCLHSRLSELHHPLPDGFKAQTMLPYQSNGTDPKLFQSFGSALIANHFRRGNTR
jgi:hypothetical protein